MPVTPAPTMSTSTSGAPTSVVPVFVPIGITYSMDLSLTEAERDLVGLCRDFAQKEIAPRAPAAWEEARCPTDLLRSEEHTSELQSLMRISYAVFCLKKKKYKQHV